MSYELSAEHEAFRAVVRDFAETEIAPHVARVGPRPPLPGRVVHADGRARAVRADAPEEYGGSGGDFTSLCVAIEELGRVDQSIGITLEAGVGLGINPILTFGTEEQKQRWLPDLVAGRALAGFGLTEPEAGSRRRRDPDPRRARRTDEWVINGARRSSPTPAPSITSVVTVTAAHRTPGRRSRRSSCRAGTPGFTVEPAVRQARLARLATPTR